MTNAVEVKIGNDTFDVELDGTVFQPRRVSSTLLDEVRVIAADSFLGRRVLTKGQRDYWAKVRTVSPEHKRFATGKGS